jgi:hypothetical protein
VNPQKRLACPESALGGPVVPRHDALAGLADGARKLNLLGNVRVKAQIEKLDARTDC